MKKIVLSLIVVLSIQGCSIAYHNEKKISGKATKIKTKMGNVDKADTYFKSTFDMLLGGIIKKEPIPPANLDFLSQ